jgi:excisionase family DNA binding protein
VKQKFGFGCFVCIFRLNLAEMSAIIQKITKSDQKIALLSAKILADSEDQATKNKDEVIKLRLQGFDEVVIIPLKALQLLNSIISNMAQGKSIALMPTDAEVSTQQAAEILNVSRPHVIKLLEKGEIPHKKVGSHRRILLQDILNYESTFKSDRRKKLDYLAKEAQQLNLGYE